jgi:hypothetical protein
MQFADKVVRNGFVRKVWVMLQHAQPLPAYAWWQVEDVSQVIGRF